MFMAKVHQVNNAGQTIKEEFPKLFDDSTLGTLKGVEVTLHVDDKKPVFIKARTVPFAIQDSYNATLDKLEAEGVIRKVTHSNWASPTVPVRKPDGSIRICADYSATINKCCNLEHHPLPTLDDMLAKLSGGSKFTNLDLSQAYHQLKLSPDSRVFTTINTHRGFIYLFFIYFFTLNHGHSGATAQLSSNVSNGQHAYGRQHWAMWRLGQFSFADLRSRHQRKKDAPSMGRGGGGERMKGG